MSEQFSPVPPLGDRLEKMIKKVRQFNRATVNDLRFAVASLGLADRVRLENEVALRLSIKGSVTAPNLDLQRVGYSFTRHGIFLEHGVGKGRPVRSAAANRSKRPWLKPVLEKRLQLLADLLSDEYATVAAEEMRILIPGVIDTKISLNG